MKANCSKCGELSHIFATNYGPMCMACASIKMQPLDTPITITRTESNELGWLLWTMIIVSCLLIPLAIKGF